MGPMERIVFVFLYPARFTREVILAAIAALRIAHGVAAGTWGTNASASLASNPEAYDIGQFVPVFVQELRTLQEFESAQRNFGRGLHVLVFS